MVQTVPKQALVCSSVVLMGLLVLAGLHDSARRLDATEGSLEAELRRSQELDERQRQILARLSRKEQVTRDAVAGRMTLLEAAAHFRALDQAAPALPPGLLRRTHGGQTDEE